VIDERTIFEAIRRNVLAVVPEVAARDIVLGCTLSDLGLNSIDRAEVVILAMEELALSVPVHEFHRGDTIEALVRVMQRHA
jgi:polyketide biosynthesis acyl carrier protein